MPPDRSSPNPLPPAEIRLREVRVEPWPDGEKVRVYLTLTPFQKRPNLEAVILDSTGMPISSASIIETVNDRLVFTMHLGGQTPPARNRLSISLSYEEAGEIDRAEVDFETNANE